MHNIRYLMHINFKSLSTCQQPFPYFDWESAEVKEAALILLLYQFNRSMRKVINLVAISAASGFKLRGNIQNRAFCSAIMSKFPSISPPVNLPTQPNNPLTEFGLQLQGSIDSFMKTIDVKIIKEDDTKDEFFRNVSIPPWFSLT